MNPEYIREQIARIPESLAGKRVLDVGAWDGYWTFEALRRGAVQAVAIDVFFDYLGCLVSDNRKTEDLVVCRKTGFTVTKMDQSFLDLDEDSFDLIWARHLIEHSIFPLFTLNDFYRVLKDGRVLYLEVPAPGTACHHERNPNHCSMLPKSFWISLLQRVGFQLIEATDYQFSVPAGDDIYGGFYCRKPSTGSAAGGISS